MVDNVIYTLCFQGQLLVTHILNIFKLILTIKVNILIHIRILYGHPAPARVKVDHPLPATVNRRSLHNHACSSAVNYTVVK